MEFILSLMLIFGNVDSQNMAIYKNEIYKQLQMVDNKTVDVYYISNLNAYMINEKLKGTFLEGTGDMMYFIEQSKGINFRAIYGIAGLESGKGKRLAAMNNFCGIKNGLGNAYRNFDSREDCLLYLADLLNHEIYKGNSLDEIGPIYCPPDETWANQVREIMWEI